MRTSILAWVIVFLGLVMIAAGTGIMAVLRPEFTPEGTEELVPVPLTDYVIPIGIIVVGIAMVGLGQALRLLLVIVKNTRVCIFKPLS